MSQQVLVRQSVDPSSDALVPLDGPSQLHPTMTDNNNNDGSNKDVETNRNNGLYFKATALLSVSEQEYIYEGCRDDCRLDGRSRLEHRHLTFHDAPLALSHGSSRVFCSGGTTHVMCSIKAELVHPSVEKPNEGTVSLHVDHVDQPNKKEQQVLQSMLSFLMVRHVCSYEDLCVVSHHYAWKLSIDVMVLANRGGSVLSVASHAIRRAMDHVRLPHTTPLQKQQKMELVVDSDYQKASTVPNLCPVVVSVAVLLGGVLVLDTTRSEELCATCIVHVAVRSSTVVAIQNTNGSIPYGLLPDILSTATQAAKQQQQQPSNNNHTMSLLQQQYQTQ